jgi:Zn-dependent hydrolases, including glyoxylases
LCGSAIATMPAPVVKQINERVYLLLGPTGLPSKENGGYMVNSVLIIGDRGLILVDTGSSDKVGQHIAATIRQISRKPVTNIINTHHHGDHTLGNVVFKGAKVISSNQCRELVEKTGYEWIRIMENMTGAKYPNTRPVPASITLQDNSTSERVIEGIKLRFWVPAGSHTLGDLLVYLPDDKVLIAGDVLVNHLVPTMMDGNVKNWIETLEKVQDFGAKTIIPGHGPLMTQADVIALHGQMARFYTGVVAGYKKGLSDSEIRKTLDLSQWEPLENFATTMGNNLNRAYLEVEAADF